MSVSIFITFVSTIVSSPESTGRYLRGAAIDRRAQNRFMPIDLEHRLRTHAPLRAGRLAELLGISRPTLSRAVRAASESLIVRGQARRRTYAARRPLRGAGSSLPVFEIDPSGNLRDVARLDLVYPEGSAMRYLDAFAWPMDVAMRDGWFEGLPYPMQDMRPQGFLGRNLAKHYAPMLQVGNDPTAWSDDDALHVMTLLGDDTPGNLLVGEPACRRWLDRLRRITAHGPEAVPDDALDSAFPTKASLVMMDGLPDSSAGGEFPKFTALRQLADGTHQHVIVKFSGSDDAPGTRRWSDLLICEHLAGRILSAHLDIPAAASRIHQHGGRTFLEVDRFDRHGVLGRSPLISWFTLNATMVGSAGRPWHEAARPLQALGWLRAQDLALIQHAWHFGELIANTDMHDGNLSLRPVTRADGSIGFAPAPIYDMLPMVYAPMRGMELPPRDFRPKLPMPADVTSWGAAAIAAVAFWRSAANDTRISAAFRAIAERNAAHLTQLL
ncbi:type II toxin-antitoxin system HipA family toxin YjjJ [Roseateles sp.]|uniref:type II toxin-antitoxin system HipA family toxin YjjJ n=1 Tax=Roseateles sp. TaxID=1971397 RepID=UPI0031DBF1D9